MFVLRISKLGMHTPSQAGSWRKCVTVLALC